MSAWSSTRRLVNRAFSSHFHAAVATVGSDGSPQVAPIGSLLLGEPGRALFFPIFASGTGSRLRADGRVCVLAVDGRALTWLAALARGRFVAPLGVRLHGRAVAAPRPSTEAERRRWLRRVGYLAVLPGFARLWGRLDTVQELEIDRVEPVRLGAMTAGTELVWGRIGATDPK